MQYENVQAPPIRSNFVTVVAYVFIAFATFTTIVAVLQNVMVNMVMPLDEIAARSGDTMRDMPEPLRFIVGHLRLFALAVLAVSATALAAAIGLLLRKNWARLALIAILVFGIAWNIAGLVLQQVMMSSFPLPVLPADAPRGFNDGLSTMLIVIRVFSFLMATGFSVLFGWIIKRLVSPTVRAEFTRSP